MRPILTALENGAGHFFVQLLTSGRFGETTQGR